MAEADRRSALFATSGVEPVRRKPNRTGLPDGLKAGVMGRRALQTKPANPRRQESAAPTAANQVVQLLTNRVDQAQYSLDMGASKITILDSNSMPRGFVDFCEAEGQFYLTTINTKSDKGPKGAGAILVYNVAFRALGKYKRVVVPNATPEQTGFYLHMGFEPDPAFLEELRATGMDQGKIDQMKHDKLSADVNKLLNEAGASMVKNWTEKNWDKGVYAGEDPEHGVMYHIPL